MVYLFIKKLYFLLGQFTEHRFNYRIGNIILDATMILNFYEDNYLTCDVNQDGKVTDLKANVSHSRCKSQSQF